LLLVVVWCMTGVYPRCFFNWYSGGVLGVQLGPVGTAATNRHIVPASGDYDVGEIGGMIGRGNRSTRRNPTPVPLCPPQTPHAVRTRTRAAAIWSQRLTTSATARTVFHRKCDRWYRVQPNQRSCLSLPIPTSANAARTGSLVVPDGRRTKENYEKPSQDNLRRNSSPALIEYEWRGLPLRQPAQYIAYRPFFMQINFIIYRA
jgi:hypothetical protein